MQFKDQIFKARLVAHLDGGGANLNISIGICYFYHIPTSNTQILTPMDYEAIW